MDELVGQKERKITDPRALFQIIIQVLKSFLTRVENLFP